MHFSRKRIFGYYFIIGSIMALGVMTFANQEIPIVSDTSGSGYNEVDQPQEWETQYPSRAKPDLDLKHTDLSYRVEEVLPYTGDRNASAYLIYPLMGIITPVQSLLDEDKLLILNKQSFDHYKYLREGTLHYVGYSPSQGVGNMVLAGHSSFYSEDEGRYKTAFQSVIYSKPGDIIWYYEKTNGDSYTRYEYQITDSRVIGTQNTTILFPTKDIRQLTTYTCYPIGGSENRRYNKADLVGIQEGYTIHPPQIKEINQTLDPMQSLVQNIENTISPINTQ